MVVVDGVMTDRFFRFSINHAETAAIVSIAELLFDHVRKLAARAGRSGVSVLDAIAHEATA